MTAPYETTLCDEIIVPRRQSQQPVNLITASSYLLPTAEKPL
jgi:hypothetical protein